MSASSASKKSLKKGNTKHKDFEKFILLYLEIYVNLVTITYKYSSLVFKVHFIGLVLFQKS